MEQITIRIPAEELEELEAEADEHGVSRSEHIRDLLASRHEDAEREAEIERLRAEVERLQKEKRLILEDREEKQELVRYVEDERSAEQRWRAAGLGTRLKWRVFGMPEDADE